MVCITCITCLVIFPGLYFGNWDCRDVIFIVSSSRSVLYWRSTVLLVYIIISMSLIAGVFVRQAVVFIRQTSVTFSFSLFHSLQE